MTLANDLNNTETPVVPGHALEMYTDLAPWFHLLTAPEEYAEEAAFFGEVLREACARQPRTLLELGSGGGNNASYLKERFRMTLVDLSAPMLDLSRGLNPECEHQVGDMRSVRLGRSFDCVMIHDAICYMTSEPDLLRAMETAHAHCRPGGAALFVPDHTRETFRPSTSCGGHDGDGRSLRYLEWSWDPDPDDCTYVTDFAYLLREGEGPPRSLGERHVEGLFASEVWLRLMAEAGFVRGEMKLFEHTDLPTGEHFVFVCQKSEGT